MSEHEQLSSDVAKLLLKLLRLTADVPELLQKSLRNCCETTYCHGHLAADVTKRLLKLLRNCGETTAKNTWVSTCPNCY